MQIRRIFGGLVMGLIFLAAGTPSAFAVITVTDGTNIVLAKQEATADSNQPVADVTGGQGGILVPYTETSSNPYTFAGGRDTRFGVPNLNDGDVGLGNPTDGEHALPEFGSPAVELNFGTTGPGPTGVVTVFGIAIYHAYIGQENAKFRLSDSLGNHHGEWASDPGSEPFPTSYWLTFPTPITTQKLLIHIEANTDPTRRAFGFREIQVFTRPRISSVLPAGGEQGQSLSVEITGENTNFVEGTTQVLFQTVQLSKLASVNSTGENRGKAPALFGITVDSVTVNSPTSLTAQITIDADATLGPRIVTVTTGSESVILANAFTVNPPSPAISSVSPSRGQQGQSLSLAITGENTSFVQGTTQVDLGLGITVDSVTVGSPTSLTAQITIDPDATLDPRDVMVTTGNEIAVLTNGFRVIAPIPPLTSTWFIPFVGSVPGQQGSFFTTETTLTNWGLAPATVNLLYTAAIGGGSGTTEMMIPPGQQVIIPNTIEDLKQRRLDLPDSGARFGTLRATFSWPPGSSPESSGSGALARTSTPVADGRAGLAYPAVEELQVLVNPFSTGYEETALAQAFVDPVYLTGLRQNATDRSNVAVQNLGTAFGQSITLRATVFSGDPSSVIKSVTLADQVLPPGGFFQWSNILALGSYSNGYVKVERVSGTASVYAYGVINDQANSDGSFVFPVSAAPPPFGPPPTGQTLPVIVETASFNSELSVTNLSDATKILIFEFVASAVQTADNTATFSLDLQPGEQKIIPNIVDDMRRRGVTGIGPADQVFVGPLFARAATGDMSEIVMGARTGSPGGGGQYGLFYTAVPFGQATLQSAWIYGLQQNEENRSNLALINTGEVDESLSVFEIDIVDGETGIKVKTETKDVPAKMFIQINGILGSLASQGYVRVTKVSGNNPFIAYGVINDGATPGDRSGDGAFIPASFLAGFGFAGQGRSHGP